MLNMPCFYTGGIITEKMSITACAGELHITLTQARFI